MTLIDEIDNPPRSRSRDLVWGLVFGLPLIAAFAWFALPGLIATIMGEASDFDQRLRQEDAYMQAVCTVGFDLERDEDLCKCALAVDYPSLDCRQPFLRWSLDRHVQTCSDEQLHKQSLMFCSCIEAVYETILPAEQAEDEKVVRQAIQGVGRCVELEDGVPLPGLDVLVPTIDPESAAKIGTPGGPPTAED